MNTGTFIRVIVYRLLTFGTRFPLLFSAMLESTAVALMAAFPSSVLRPKF
ncbi:hypothetical protein HHJ49_00035 [Escherichia coli]|nr:hypothetical protein HHJ49_00035 [Escherichia coli]